MLLEEHNRADRNEEEEAVTWSKRPEYMVTDFGQEIIFGAATPITENSYTRKIEEDLSLLLVSN